MTVVVVSIARRVVLTVEYGFLDHSIISTSPLFSCSSLITSHDLPLILIGISHIDSFAESSKPLLNVLVRRIRHLKQPLFVSLAFLNISFIPPTLFLS